MQAVPPDAQGGHVVFGTDLVLEPAGKLDLDALAAGVGQRVLQDRGWQARGLGIQRNERSERLQVHSQRASRVPEFDARHRILAAKGDVLESPCVEFADLSGPVCDHFDREPLFERGFGLRRTGVMDSRRQAAVVGGVIGLEDVQCHNFPSPPR